MNEHTKIMMEVIKELVAIGTYGIAHCQPCLKHHIYVDISIQIENHYPADWDSNSLYLYIL